MKKWMFRIMVLIAYCIPFGFLAMYGDAEKDTMALYGVMILGFAMLSYASGKSKHVIVFLLGNALSYLSSYAFMLYYQTEKWQWYFKPLTATALLLLITVIGLLLQGAFIGSIYHKQKNKTQ